MTEQTNPQSGGAILIKPGSPQVQSGTGTIVPPGQPVVPAITPPAGMKPNLIVRSYRSHDGKSTHNYIPGT